MDAADISIAIREAGYHIDGQPRRGATASVYAGHRIADDLAVALKVMDKSARSADFNDEADVLSGVRHPNVAALVDVQTLDDGRHLLVTEWADGETLAERLTHGGPLDISAVRRVLIQLADALDHLHRHGIVHRDLSLANILITDDHRITLIDFGIARTNDQPTFTATSDLVGTTRYLAPELLEGAPPSPATDQYAAAVIAYELSAGVWPFDEADNVGRTFHHHLSSAPIPLVERVPAAPTSLDAALERSLSKDPNERFPTMQAMADAALGGATANEPRRPAIPGRALAAALLFVAAIGIAWLGLSGPDRNADADEAEAEANTVATDATTEIETAPSTTTTSIDVESAPVTTWPSGLAGELDCNLLDTPGFEANSLPDNFWVDPQDLGRERLVADQGVDGSAAVAIGRDGEFGAFGTIIDVRPNAEYLFAASVSFSEAPFVSQISVRWLDANFELLDERAVVGDLLTAAPGRAVVEVPPPPANAAFAVTRLYKDDSGGVLFADELVFAERSTACEQLVGLGP